jgi:hypothetical protein
MFLKKLMPPSPNRLHGDTSEKTEISTITVKRISTITGYFNLLTDT